MNTRSAHARATRRNTHTTRPNATRRGDVPTPAGWGQGILGPRWGGLEVFVSPTKERRRVAFPHSRVVGLLGYAVQGCKGRERRGSYACAAHVARLLVFVVVVVVAALMRLAHTRVPGTRVVVHGAWHTLACLACFGCYKLLLSLAQLSRVLPTYQLAYVARHPH